MGTASVPEFLMTAFAWFSMVVCSSSWISVVCKHFVRSLHVVIALPQDISVQNLFSRVTGVM